MTALLIIGYLLVGFLTTAIIAAVLNEEWEKDDREILGIFAIGLWPMLIVFLALFWVIRLACFLGIKMRALHNR